MLIYPDEVRRAMRLRSPEELNRIASGHAAEYTPEAQEIAREALKELLAMPREIEEPPLPPPPPGETWRAQLAAWRAQFAAWRRSQLPAEIPDRIADLFWLGVLFAAGAVVPLFRSAFDVPLTTEDAVTLALAAAGITLAHGIYREHRYPRPLAVVFVAAVACSGLFFRRRNDNSRVIDLGALAHAWNTIKYLVSDSEAVRYYAGLKESSRPPSDWSAAPDASRR